jgi:NAD-dependent deacetylase sirtuin 4
MQKCGISSDVDSFHPIAHPHIKTLELHGYLRSAVCITCRTEYNRQLFQRDLSALNPTWHSFLTSIISSGALTTENPEERRRLGLKTNADGDVDVPGVDYTTFRYPACPSCLANPGKDKDGNKRVVNVDNDGAFVATNSTAGILKPNVIMFGESIPDATKIAAEQAVDEAARLLVLGSSLATYSAWRLVKRAREQGMPIGIVNIGGVRGEEQFFAHLDRQNRGDLGLRCAHVLEDLLPMLVEELARRDEGHTGLLVASAASAAVGLGRRFVPAPWA